MKRIPYRQTAASSSSSQGGFTIVEMMIATVIFSVVLLIITVGVLRFTSSYYKGINSSATQNAAQSAMDTITQAVQFGSAAPVGTDAAPSGVFCAGNQMFLYTLGVKYTGATPAAGNWGLYMFPNPQVGDCDTSGISDFSGGTELLGTNMRLTYVSLISTNDSLNLWQVALSVAYGSSDLLCNTETPSGTTGACDKSAPNYAKGSPDTTVVKAADDTDNVFCKLQTGSQFCSTSVMSVVAQQRVTGS